MDRPRENRIEIEWSDVLSDPIVAPDTAAALLQRAAARAPDDASIRVNLGLVLLRQLKFPAAVDAFEAALVLDPSRHDARLALARCWTRMGRHGDVLTLLDRDDTDASAHALYLRGMAALASGEIERAERDFHAVLERDAHHREAYFELGRILRASGRLDALETVRAELWERGARHVQLLLDWGRTLASAGRVEEARHLLFAPSMVTRTSIETPAGFPTLAAFNAAVAAELADNPFKRSDIPADELAIRNSTRVSHPMAGRRPELIGALLAAIRDRIDRALAAAPDRAEDGTDPWLACQPARATLRAWANIQGPGGYEDWHAHRAGWLSGVYYVEVPGGLSADGDGAGCIEFGAPPALAEMLPETLRIAPREGMLLLMPSQVHHRTIPFAAKDRRISFAFDVRPAGEEDRFLPAQTATI
ncbi:2OG-Fe(II) oxygenase family protein [Amorphus suaedae]